MPQYRCKSVLQTSGFTRFLQQKQSPPLLCPDKTLQDMPGFNTRLDPAWPFELLLEQFLA
jgi:hypothetical protein